MKTAMQKSLFITVAVFCTLLAHAEIYKWVDKDGIAHYADTRPEDETLEVKEFLGSPIKMDENGLVVQASDSPVTTPTPRQNPPPVKPEKKPEITLTSLLADAKEYFYGLLGRKPSQVPEKKLAQSPKQQPSRPETPQPFSRDTVVITNENMGEVLEQIALDKQAQQEKEEVLANPDVEIFTTPWCGYCKKATTYLKLNKIQYKEYDVSSNSSAAMRQQMLGGGGGVPFAVINGQKIRGWSQQAYASALGL